MAKDSVLHASVVAGLFIAALVGLALHALGTYGSVLWVPTIWTFVAGAFLVVKECPDCKQLIFRRATTCSECTADRKR